MKAMRYILVGIVLLVLPFMTVNAQFGNHPYGQSQKPCAPSAELAQYQFHTTSSLSGSGSTLPIAAHTGAVISGNAPGEEYAASPASGRRRIGGSGSGTEGNGAQENDDPQETPLGDGMWALLMMAGAYAVCRKRLRKQKVTA